MNTSEVLFLSVGSLSWPDMRSAMRDYQVGASCMFYCYLYFVHFFKVVLYKKGLLLGRCVVLFWIIQMFFILVLTLVSIVYKEFLEENIDEDIPITTRFCVLFISFSICLFCNILYSKFHTIECVSKKQSAIYLGILFGVSIFSDADHFYQYNELILLLSIQISELLDS